jgi:hypothetical protein
VKAKASPAAAAGTRCVVSRQTVANTRPTQAVEHTTATNPMRKAIDPMGIQLNSYPRMVSSG